MLYLHVFAEGGGRPLERRLPGYTTSISIYQDPLAKCNAQAMEVSDKAKNLEDTLPEQSYAEQGIKIDSFEDLRTRVGSTFVYSISVSTHVLPG